jgi:phosphate transport system protein
VTTHTTHTDRQYEEELGELRQRILAMGGLVEKQIANAVEALTGRNRELADETISKDHAVNRLDVEIDDLCIRLLALRQPAARDLRFITTALKITTDLERIGDMAVNICERALELNEEPTLKPYIDIPRMAKEAQAMVRTSLDAFVQRDTAAAAQVIDQDDTVDALAHQVYRELLSFMAEDPRTIARATRILLISKYLERIADHATNIAEMVVFMVDGKMIRHAASLPEEDGELE